MYRRTILTPGLTPGSRTSFGGLPLKALGFIALLAAGLAVFVAYAGYEAQARWQRATESVAAEANTRAAGLQEWLLRLDRTLSWFRAEDFSPAGRIAVTVRMLQNERFVAPAQTLFLVSPAGRLLAGTLPLPDEPTAISARRWFKSLQASPASPGVQLTACTQDPFRAAAGVVVYRAIFDRDVVAGYVGSFLPQPAIAGMLRDADMSDGTVHFALLSASGEAFGCQPAEPWHPVAQYAGLRDWLARATQLWPQLGWRDVVSDERAIGPGGLRLIATADALDAMSDEDWTALTYRAAYVVTTLVLIVALLGSMLARQGRPARAGPKLHPAEDAADGADWMWELDENSNLVGLAGNVPDHLLPPSGRSLAEMAGAIGSNDLRWERFDAAVYARHAFEGLELPFQIPGRPGTLTIFALSGQPVLASGGFWGTASLVSEESVARRTKPALVKAGVSIA